MVLVGGQSIVKQPIDVRAAKLPGRQGNAMQNDKINRHTLWAIVLIRAFRILTGTQQTIDYRKRRCRV